MIDLIISDLHLCPQRQGGTTIESRAALEDWQFSELAKILEHPHDRLIIAGDLFDKSSVTDIVLKRTFDLLRNEKEVIILRGNHDEKSQKINDICSLELLSHLLPNVHLIFDEPETIGNCHFIPHCFSQELFDKYISEVPYGKNVFLHCNYDNYFATEADHSLNLSKEQKEQLRYKGSRIFLGHEHTFNTDDEVFRFGCTLPTSIADCIGGEKVYWIFDENYLAPETAWIETDFIDVNYADLDTIGDQHFIRISGECAIEEFQKISRDISKLRAESKAFIISNNVKVLSSNKDILSLEEVTKINVIDMLLELIPDQFKDEVKSCI